MCGSASERTRAMSWGETVIGDGPAILACGEGLSGAFYRDAVIGGRAISPVVPAKAGAHNHGLRIRVPAFAGTTVRSTAFVHDPSDRGAELGHAVAGPRRGCQHLGERRRMP